MRLQILVFFTVALIAACSSTSIAQEGGKVSQELFSKAVEKGIVRVIVDLDAKSIDIESGQTMMETELRGTTYRVLRGVGRIPMISLEVGPAALLILDSSRLVVKVTEVAFQQLQ
jgi:hypothetical protein